MAVQVDFLKSTTYFTGLSPAELASISAHFYERNVARGEIIESEGENCGVIYFVASGVVKVFKTSPDGREQILRLVRPGETFCEAPVLGNMPSLASAQALGPGVLYLISKADLEAVIQKFPRVAVNIIQSLSLRIRDLAALVEDLSFRNVISRIAKILLEYSGDGDTKPRLTQQDMAAMAGTAREVVGRSLKALEEAGSIKLDRHRIVIRDKRALGKVAGLSE